MSEADILKQIQALSDQNKALSEKLEALTEEDDLEKDFEIEEKPKQSQMLNINPSITDSFGDSIELVTKSRIADNAESFRIAKTFVEREYHNMLGNRFGKHSKLIPVFNDDGTKNKIDMVWFSGNDIKVVDINGKAFYKIRLLVYDILIKKILITRIPITGAARQEEINYIGAEKSGNRWTQEHNPMEPMKPINYKPPIQGKTTMRNVGEVIYE